jgi:hypothetical protein
MQLNKKNQLIHFLFFLRAEAVCGSSGGCYSLALNNLEM